MFMPSLNNYNTRSQMALDIPLCSTIKGQKVCYFWSKDLEYVKFKYKNSCKYSFFHAPFENDLF